MDTQIIDIGLICVGSVVRVPITACNTNANIIIPDVSVIISPPSGLNYLTATVPKGSYDNATKTWTVGSLGKGECLVGEIQYVVNNDAFPEYRIEYTVSTTSNCATCSDVLGCVLLQGLSCSQIAKCNPEKAFDNRYLCGSGIECEGDVSSNDQGCVTGLLRTYEWLNTDLAMGTITGDPDDFSYLADPGFCGVGNATYGLYCNDILVDTANVRFDVTCNHPSPDSITIGINDTSDLTDASGNDFPCLFGAINSWHLVSDPTADGSGLSEPTSEEDVVVVEWNIDTGTFVVDAINDFSGNATFTYTMRCSDSQSSVVYESSPVTVTITVEPL